MITLAKFSRTLRDRVAAAEVLDEGMPGGHDPRGPVTFQPPHRPQPGFQPPVIGFSRVVRVPLHGVQR
jgi:hypothetical protein